MIYGRVNELENLWVYKAIDRQMNKLAKGRVDKALYGQVNELARWQV